MERYCFAVDPLALECFCQSFPSFLIDSIDIATLSATGTPELNTNNFELSVFTLKGLTNTSSNVVITSLTEVSDFRTLDGRSCLQHPSSRLTPAIFLSASTFSACAGQFKHHLETEA